LSKVRERSWIGVKHQLVPAGPLNDVAPIQMVGIVGISDSSWLRQKKRT
jgi:hypothetical protein